MRCNLCLGVVEFQIMRIGDQAWQRFQDEAGVSELLFDRRSSNPVHASGHEPIAESHGQSQAARIADGLRRVRDSRQSRSTHRVLDVHLHDDRHLTIVNDPVTLDALNVQGSRHHRAVHRVPGARPQSESPIRSPTCESSIAKVRVFHSGLPIPCFCYRRSGSGPFA